MAKKKACRFVRIDAKRPAQFDVELPPIPDSSMEAVRQRLWAKLNDANDELTVEKVASWYHKTLGHPGPMKMEIKELFRRMIEYAVGEQSNEA